MCDRIILLVMVGLMLFVGSAAAVSATLGTCPDDVFNETGVGGKGATAILNVSDAGECCDMCHNNYHDECAAWIFGHSGANSIYAEHNCAIMPKVLQKRQVSGHMSGIVKAPPSPSPSPSPSDSPCRADLDCDLSGSGSGLWRCGKSNSGGGNCHAAGPSTEGNTTCVCRAPKCAAGAKEPESASATQYLMIGDSISLGMQNKVDQILKPQGFELTHNPGNAASANLGQHCLANWLQTAPPASRTWDVISFQFGLHDLAFDVERITVEQYQDLLESITADLVAEQKSRGTKLLWVSTTPVPTVPTYGPDCNETSKCLNPPRFDADVVLYNAAADEVLEKAKQAGAEISKLDLYSFVLEKCGGNGYSSCSGFQLDQNVHFTDAGWTALAGEMSSAVLAAARNATNTALAV